MRKVTSILCIILLLAATSAMAQDFSKLKKAVGDKLGTGAKGLSEEQALENLTHEGMARKSEEFKAVGGEFYVPVDRLTKKA